MCVRCCFLGLYYDVDNSTCLPFFLNRVIRLLHRRGNKFYSHSACDMPRRSYPGTGFSPSAPNRLRYFAVLSAAWGAAGFRPTLPQIIRRAALCSAGPTTSISDGCIGRVKVPAAPYPGSASLGGISTTVLAVRSRGETAAVEDVGDGAGSEGGVIVERPWLGNGADPMADERNSLPSSLAAAEAGVGRGEKGKGVPTDEVWMNGPFQAPVAAGPVVSGGVLQWCRMQVQINFACCLGRCDVPTCYL